MGRTGDAGRRGTGARGRAEERSDVVVVGGGLTGLAAAVRVARGAAGDVLEGRVVPVCCLLCG
ncbi:hypothetical protein ACWD4N_44060, partial [Streptomyces sp. NPDC002586]